MWPLAIIRGISAGTLWESPSAHCSALRSRTGRRIAVSLRSRAGCLLDGLPMDAARAGHSNRHPKDQTAEAGMQPRRAIAAIKYPHYAFGVAICIFQIYQDKEITPARESVRPPQLTTRCFDDDQHGEWLLKDARYISVPARRSQTVNVLLREVRHQSFTAENCRMHATRCSARLLLQRTAIYSDVAKDVAIYMWCRCCR